jgi:hypothetical protein
VVKKQHRRNLPSIRRNLQASQPSYPPMML